ncbi:PRC-barrel domain-containing protein [Roseateles violae]|uniref:PRC-barrel domain-containing protein n=1 Tax=Roseateles violae TaxID=3058042 RepID=A0ABT8DQ68_9BURK|nr:PRC-barrel domain-containing protein [Pelomonas sp. PFR6]MDN3920499.1 PRC-barrel domain-containing protein [Pelomonas sp. PFR6]
MLNRVERINGATIAASDGAIGSVKEFYFDDERWVIRYLVVDTGGWLSERKVLISPYAIRQPLAAAGAPIEVRLTREQVRLSPDIDTHQPVSRRHERDYAGYYAYPDYWGGVDLWAMGGYPILPPPEAALPGEPRHPPREEEAVAPEDVHLRSSEHVSGYDIEASDGSIGHVKDFIFDDESWAISYLLVDTRNWWPGGRKVLIATDWIDSIDWSQSRVCVKLSREQVKASPEYEEAMVIDRAYEQRLHEAFERRAYWD